MELVIVISILIAVVSVFVSCLTIRRVKRQISEMTDALADIKNGNGNRRILSAANELVAPIAYEINEIVVSYESKLSTFHQTEETNRQLMLQKGKDVEIDGYKGFIFIAKSGRPLMPSAINNILYNIVDAYNKKEVQIAKTEHRNAELLPKVSAHIMRHTACTRMAEKRMDVKVLQYIMGHAHIDVTMDVYNHVSEMSRIESEITRLENVAIS